MDGKKILFYNWIQFDKKNNSGGGVNLYQKNIIDYFVKHTNYEIFFLSSGIYYNLFKHNIYIKLSSNVYGNKCKTYKLINSPCIAPVSAMYSDIEIYLKDKSCYNVFLKFIKDNNIDIIHFNNLEGLTLECLKIKKDLPNVKVIYSLHNYFMFCPQVNLFYSQKENCLDFQNGSRCTICLSDQISKKQYLIYYKIDRFLEKFHLGKQSFAIKKKFKSLYLSFKRGKKAETDNTAKCIGTPKEFWEFRNDNVDVLNKDVDIVLAVSERVREIALRYGVNKNKVITNYIGTEAAEHCKYKYHGRKGDFTISFMGYFEKIKGLDFLLECFEQMPCDLTSQMVFKCYARKKTDADQNVINRIYKLENRFKRVEYYDGYDHDDLPDILSDIDLGIVPVIWEDNLPQVAIEYAAYGVPVLASNLGGAHELSHDDDFVFEACDHNDFIKKLIAIVKNPEKLEEYFEQMIKLTTISEHVNTLKKIYENEI